MYLDGTKIKYGYARTLKDTNLFLRNCRTCVIGSTLSPQAGWLHYVSLVSEIINFIVDNNHLL